MIDITLKLEDGAAEKTSSGYGEVDSTAQILDLGYGLIKGNMIIDLTRLAMQGNSQLYKIVLLGGSDASFSEEATLAILELGPKETTGESKDSKLARYIVPFQNEQNGVVFPYARARHVLSGSGPLINFVARLEKDLPVRGLISAQTTTTT